jgi:thioredoxin reductase (NADPH)
VVGGGDTAVEEALYLAKITNKVYLAHRRDALRASPILQKRVFENDKVEILWDTVPSAIHAEDGGVNRVTLKNTKTAEKSDLSVDGVFIFIGYLPNSKLVPEAVKRADGGYVVTDSRCETNIPGIFAIGDLAEKFARQIVTAAGDGCTAALAAAQYVELKKASDDL